MSCFWQGIMASLTTNDMKILKISNNSLLNLIKSLQNLNTKNITTLWQNQEISKQQKEENFIHIRDYQVTTHNKGYLCGTCDPFLILLSHILQIDIKHKYMRHEIHYSNNSENIYFFKSNRGHFVYKTKQIN